MNSFLNAPKLVVGLLLFAAPPVTLCADTDPGRFQTIVERNVFGLRSPPPPPAQTNVVETKPSNVKLTGFTTIVSPPRALIMVQDEGKMTSLVLREGQREGPILVKSIDVKKGEVRIANGPTDELLTFETHGIKPNMAPAITTASATTGRSGGSPRSGRVAPGGVPRPAIPMQGSAANVSNPGGINTSQSGNIPPRIRRTPSTPSSQSQTPDPALHPASQLSQDEAAALRYLNALERAEEIRRGLVPPYPGINNDVVLGEGSDGQP